MILIQYNILLEDLMIVKCAIQFKIFIFLLIKKEMNGSTSGESRSTINEIFPTNRDDQRSNEKSRDHALNTALAIWHNTVLLIN